MQKVFNKNTIILSVLLIILVAMAAGGCIMFQNKKVMTVNVDNFDDTFKNPLNISNIGDPFVLKASDGKYYLYATSAQYGFYVWSSINMLDWTKIGYAFQVNGDNWANKDFWAPEVVEYKGKYYMYYSARCKDNGSLRIGVAVSDSPTGPFVNPENKPMFDFGYAAIDADVIVDEDGRKYMYYSRDCSENIVSGRHESHIYGIELNDDMLSVKGEPVLLIKPDQAWELQSGEGWRWNEGPLVFKKNGIYYMMYSANFYADKKYGIGYAVSKTPLGPFIKYEKNPIVSYVETEDEILVSGPGHNSLTLSPDNKEYYIVYHSHTDAVVGGGNRQVCIDKLGFREDGTLYVNGPTITPQFLPSGLSKYKNIAIEAKVTVSSIKEGFSADGINDGEIGVNIQSEKYDWVTNNKFGEFIKLQFDKAKKVNKLFIYNSTNSEKMVLSGRLEFDNGYKTENIQLSTKPGEATIVSFEEMDVKWIKFVLEKGQDNSQEAGLSEIMIVGQ
ncbi:glycoside hydrolase family 43 protein [Clostridium sp. SYSU_GA19001]|uniref:glycoside hydrolase family 43 protein n=1 Tax=Clostridium caldaquaticum TaxID=2940653 RepID=UPI0020770599|nr:glycoside hydrolase family 43 protein [Clostridium caldaquaticum]MCM8709689.1 glycoside hydrolase family 43 protein [Clostridium caldaquaticum]